LKKLLIAIPSFNEYKYLKNSLKTLIPQILNLKNKVDLYLIDNNSTDETESAVSKLFNSHSNCFYVRNNENIGLYPNQLKCLKVKGYEYQMVLGSDDILVPNAINTILKYIEKDNFSILYLNYYSFLSDYSVPHQFFSEEKDVIFNRPYDLLNHPSVGHFSGFIFKSILMEKHLDFLLEKYDTPFFEKHRGIIAFLAAYICSKESNQTLFIGSRLLATNSRKSVSYDSLQHLCVDYLEGHYLLYKDGLCNKNDFLYRKELVKKMLFRSSIRNLPFLDINTNKQILNSLSFYFTKDFYFILFIQPIFYIMRLNILKKSFQCLISRYLKSQLQER